MSDGIDIVIPWVDGSDYDWLKQIKEYASGSISYNRYQSWDNLQYIFRGIEKFLPWYSRFCFCNLRPFAEMVEY